CVLVAVSPFSDTKIFRATRGSKPRSRSSRAGRFIKWDLWDLWVGRSHKSHESHRACRAVGLEEADPIRERTADADLPLLRCLPQTRRSARKACQLQVPFPVHRM